MGRDAGRALHWAPGRGSGAWAVYDPARQDGDSARLALTAPMRSALDAGQFSVVYQPIVQLPSGELRGLEALLRWHHPVLGMLSPEAFIALAEESGVIAALGRWVMRTACRRRRNGSGYAPAPRRSSASISPRSRPRTRVSSVTMARVLAETGLPRICCSWSSPRARSSRRTAAPLETLQKLSAMGVRIGAADFGSGYSNLAYLRRLPGRRAEAVRLVHGGRLGRTAPPTSRSSPP